MYSTSEIRAIIKAWLNDTLQDNPIPNETMAMSFNIQRTHNEFEIYLTGHDDFYFDHDTWLLSEVYEPKSNFKGLGIESIKLSDQEIYEVYKHEVYDFIKDKIDAFPVHVRYFNCKFPSGIPELLIER